VTFVSYAVQLTFSELIPFITTNIISTMNAGRSAAANTNFNKSRIAFQDVSNRVEQDGASKLGKGKAQKQKRTVHTVHSAAVVAKKKTASLPKTVVHTSSGAVVRKAVHRAIPRSSQPKLPSSSKQTAATRARDIDARDQDDPLMVTDYVQDMFQYFREQESRAVVGPYLGDDDDAIQPNISQRMRAILVDWLVDIHHKMKCDPTVLYLTVQILDRFLAADVKKASKKNLQLIGTSAFLIASKYEQIYPAPICDLVYVCDRIYTEDDIISMETTILKALNYQISLPTSHNFLLRFLNAAHADRKLVFLTQYLLETSLHSYNLVIKYTPSQLAAATILIGRVAIGRNNWSPTLVKYAEYSEEDIIPIARDLMEENKKLRFGLTAVKRKYSRDKYLKVASAVLPSEL